jgi:hypothetical protein
MSLHIGENMTASICNKNVFLPVEVSQAEELSLFLCVLKDGEVGFSQGWDQCLHVLHSQLVLCLADTPEDKQNKDKHKDFLLMLPENNTQ